MNLSRFAPAFAVAAIVAMAAAPVSAHARLVSSTPAADATIAPTRSVALTFSERMVPAFSTVEVVSATGVKASLSTSVSEDARSITGTLARPLTAGTWTVNWQIASSDGHRMTGSYAFTVR